MDMDKAKLRLMAGVGGALLGFIGALALAAAGIIALAGLVGYGWSALIVGGILFAASFVGIMAFIAPFRETEEELSDMGDATADILADLPFDTVKAFIEKRPITALTVAVFAGYAATKDPDNAVRHAQRMVASFI